jgi:hypothetical protein
MFDKTAAANRNLAEKAIGIHFREAPKLAGRQLRSGPSGRAKPARGQSRPFGPGILQETARHRVEPI